MSDFRVQGQLGLDGSGFFSTLGKARSAVGSFGGMLAGAFSIGAITAFSKSVLGLAGHLKDVSEALNINVEFLQRFLNAARTSGGSLEDIEKFLFEANKSRQAAVNKPAGAEARAFTKLGFTETDISKLNPQQFVEKIIAAFSDGASVQEINALSEIGGKAAKKLVGGFKDGLDYQTGIIQESLIDELDAIGDKFTSIGTTLKTMFAPALKSVADAIRYVLDKIEQVQAFYGSLIGSGLAGGQTFAQSRREAIEARDEVRRQQRERADNEAAARAAKKEAKKRENETPPDFKNNEAPPKVAVSSVGVYSDARLAVGGFLGAGRGTALASIAERQLTIQTQSLNVQQLILAAVKTAVQEKSLVIP